MVFSVVPRAVVRRIRDAFRCLYRWRVSTTHPPTPSRRAGGGDDLYVLPGDHPPEPPGRGCTPAPRATAFGSGPRLIRRKEGTVHVETAPGHLDLPVGEHYSGRASPLEPQREARTMPDIRQYLAIRSALSP